MSHILVVEDEAIIRTALKRMLERHQYQVQEAGSVAETEQYDLKICVCRASLAPR